MAKEVVLRATRPVDLPKVYQKEQEEKKQGGQLMYGCISIDGVGRAGRETTCEVVDIYLSSVRSRSICFDGTGAIYHGYTPIHLALSMYFYLHTRLLLPVRRAGTWTFDLLPDSMWHTCLCTIRLTDYILLKYPSYWETRGARRESGKE